MPKKKFDYQIEIETRSSKWKNSEILQKQQISGFITKTCKKIIGNTELASILDDSAVIQLSISLVSNAQIKKINHQFRDKNKPTDILSFGFMDEKIIQKKGLKSAIESNKFVALGDLVLAYETIALDAKLQSKTFENHLIHLFTHGILHLLGFDHEKPKMAEVMENLEIEILQHFKIKNPYEI